MRTSRLDQSRFGQSRLGLPSFRGSLTPAVPADPVASNLVATVLDETSASLTVNTNKSDGDVFAVVINTATGTLDPDAAQIIAGTDGGDAAPAWDHNQGVSQAGVQTFAGGVTGLTEGQTYRAYAVYRDDDLNVSGVIASGDFVPADVTAPVLSSLDLSEAGIDNWSGTVNTDTGEGVLDVVITAFNTAPLASQIVAGHDHTGAEAADFVQDQAVTASGPQVLAGSASLSGATEYFGYAVHTDASGNVSDVLSVAASFTTDPIEPAAFVDADWSVATGSADREIDITIASLPNDNNSPITDVQYEVDASGSWVSLPSYAGVGTYSVVMPAGSTSYDFRLRAVNAIGNGAAGNTEAATSYISDFTPASLGAKLHQYILPSVLTSLWATDGARTTNVAADGDRAYIFDDQSAYGNHLIDRNTAGAITYKTSGGKHWLNLTGDGGMLYEAMPDFNGTAGGRDFWFRVRILDDSVIFLGDSSGPANYCGAFQDGNGSSSIDFGFGSSVDFEVNGVQPTLTRDGLHAAATTGNFETVVMRSVGNLTARGATLMMLHYASATWHFEGDVAAIAVTASDITAQERADMYTFMATLGN